jgi:hypothetical protein
MQRWKILSAPLVLALTLVSAAADAQTTIVATVLAGKKVSEIIEQVRMAGVSLLSQADSSGNAMIAHGANEANVVATNLSFQFRDRLDQTFDRLNDQEKQLLIEADSLRSDLTKLGDKAYDAKDTLAVDLNFMLDRFPFLSKGFFLQSVRGLSYFPGTGSYQLRVIASTLGVQEDVKTVVALSVEGMNVANLEVDQSQQRGQAFITIPPTVLASRFSNTELKLVHAKLTFTVTRKAGWGIFSHNVQDKPYEVPLTFSLYPRRAATVVASAHQPVYAWVNLPGGPMTVHKDTPDRNCEKRCGGEPTRGPNSIDMKVPGIGGDSPVAGNQRFIPPVALECKAGPCGGWFGAVNTYITDNGTRAVGTWDTWSRPTTWYLSATVQEYKMIGEAPWAAPTADAKFGDVIVFDFPKGATVDTLKVTTFTKNEYTIFVQQPDPKDILHYQSKESGAPPTVDRFLYQVRLPRGVQ